MFVKTVFKSSFCFSYVLLVAAVAVYHVNKMPAILALRVMLGLIHLFQLYASPIENYPC